MSAVPYARLGAFYFWYFASLGALLPYWGLYLESRGFSGAQIGAAMGILLGTKVFAPYLWGWVADHYGYRLRLIRVATAAAVVAFALIPQTDSFWTLALVLLLYAFFWNASLPQFEAVTMNFLGEQAADYGRIRLWGSVGFIFSVIALGPLIERFGPQSLPYCVVPLLVAKWLSTLLLLEPAGAASAGPRASLARVLREPAVLALLAVCFLVQFSHGPYYGFYTLYMRDAGYSEGVIGVLWALGVVSEIYVFIAMPRWLRNYGPRKLMLAAVAITALRWILLAAVPQFWGMAVLIQLMHMATFGLYHAVGIHLINAMFTGTLQGRGQALYSAVSFGAGGACGSLAAGMLWQAGMTHDLYLLSAAAAALALLIAMLGLHYVPRTLADPG